MRKKIIALLLGIVGMGMVSFAAADYCEVGDLLGIDDGHYVARVLLTGASSTLDSITTGDAPAPNYYWYYTGLSVTGLSVSAPTVPSLQAGQTYSLTVQVGVAEDLHYIAGWIDFNGDGTFDSSEKLGQASGYSGSQLATFTFTVPLTAHGDPTRLRVRNKRFTITVDPCDVNNQWGESEDYNVRILSASSNKRKVIPEDICPAGDFSPTQYDGLCSGMSPSNGTLAGATTQPIITITRIATGSVAGTGTVDMTGSLDTPADERVDRDACADVQVEEAFIFAHKNGITTMETCMTARMEDSLTRAEAAKMISNFAMNVLGLEPDTSRKCAFSDMATIGAEMQQYAKTACQLGLMGFKGDGSVAATFNPHGLLDKAQLATMLSRITYGDKNNDAQCWYCKHVEALKAMGTITVTNDLFQPLKRGWAMLMLMRFSQSEYTPTN